MMPWEGYKKSKIRYHFGVRRLFYDGLTVGVEFKSKDLRQLFLKYMKSELAMSNSWGIEKMVSADRNMIDITFKTMESRNDFSLKIVKGKREVYEWTKRYNVLRRASSKGTEEGTGKKDFS